MKIRATRKFLSAIFAMALVFLVITDALDAQDEITAVPSTHAVTINGEEVVLRGYSIGSSNFFRLRDMAYALSGIQAQFGVDWHGNTIYLFPGPGYTPVGGEMQGHVATQATAWPTTADIRLWGAEIDLRGFNIEGSNYFMLRDLGFYLGFDVDWDEAAQTILIDTGEPYVSNEIKQAIEDFLSGFPSLFNPEILAGLIWHLDETSDYVTDGSVAGFYRLMDIDGDGVPEIIIYWASIYQSGPLTGIIYRLVDGMFVPVPEIFIRDISLFKDGLDRIVIIRVDEIDGNHGVDFICLDDGHDWKILEQITIDWEERQAWIDFHTSLDFWLNPTLFGTDIPLTRLRPMIALQNQITANILERLENQ